MMDEVLAIVFLVIAMIIVMPVFIIAGTIVGIHMLEDYQMNEEYDHCIPRDDKNGGIT